MSTDYEPAVPKEHVVLVCGGRDYQNWDHVNGYLTRMHARIPITCIIQGGARGADALAKRWAQEHDVKCWTFEADWAGHGKAAGAIRNQEMLTVGKPDLVVAFPGGKGTLDMIARARAVTVPVIAVESWTT